LQLLHDISKEGKAVLMATHDYAGMKKFNSRTIICSEGKLKEATEVGGYTDFV
jgi:cell division transport system ATP-binding protein